MMDYYNSQNMIYYAPVPSEAPDFREKMARRLGFASLLYAAFSTFCLYKNLCGITMPFFAVATLVYMIYSLKQYDVEIKRTSWFYAFVILALSVIDFLTGNLTILFYNKLGMGLMIFIFMLHNVYDDSRWNFGKTAMSVFESFIFSVGAMDDFGKDMAVLRQRSAAGTEGGERRKTIKYVFIGLVIAFPVVAILMLLLSEADLVFGSLITRYLLVEINFGNGIGVAITFLLIYFAAYCTMRFFSKKTLSEEVVYKRNYEPVIAITVLSMVSLLYIVFSVIQFVYLFRGEGTPPGGYTYAQYAHEGFYQLLAVSIINFLMVIFVNSRFRENIVLKVLMTIISLCTYVMIASSYFRIKMYIDAYLLTSLRIWVLWGLAVLSLLFIAVIVSIYKNEFPLFRYSIIVVSVLYIIIGFARMDYIIADYNLSHAKTLESAYSVDYDYLANLSTDAAPIIANYDEGWTGEYFDRCSSFYEDRSLRQFNLSAYIAEKLRHGDGG